MHELVKGQLEEYLHGKVSSEVAQHLAGCEECRRETAAMTNQSLLFRSLRPPESVEAPVAFYSKVMNRIESQVRPSAWSIFGESLFAKRLAYASMTFLVLLASFLINLERQQVDEDIFASAPEAIFAVNEQPIPIESDPQRGREVVLVNLTSYQGF